MAEDIRELERKGQRLHDGKSPFLRYLRRFMRAEAEDDEDD